jgi:hypothetical protein
MAEKGLSASLSSGVVAEGVAHGEEADHAVDRA